MCMHCHNNAMHCQLMFIRCIQILTWTLILHLALPWTIILTASTNAQEFYDISMSLVSVYGCISTYMCMFMFVFLCVYVCMHVCTSYVPSIIINTATHYQRLGFQLSCCLFIFLWLKAWISVPCYWTTCKYGYPTGMCSHFPSSLPYLFSYQTTSKLLLVTSLWFQMVKFSSAHRTVPLVEYHE
jgi:hypothetical protein